MNLEPLGDWVDVCPWKSRRVIFFSMDNTYEELNSPSQAISITEKKEMLQDLNNLLWVMWPGEWSSSIREIGLEHRLAVLAKF